jgi:hypothetical protein
MSQCTGVCTWMPRQSSWTNSPSGLPTPALQLCHLSFASQESLLYISSKKLLSYQKTLRATVREGKPGLWGLCLLSPPLNSCS